MKALSSLASITVHVALGAAVLFGTANSGRSDPPRRVVDTLFFQPATSVEANGDGSSLPGPVTVVPLDLGAISVSTPLPKTGATMPVFSPVYSGAVSTPGTGQPGGWGGLLTEEHAEVLTAPLPLYPDLLRQAGVQGRVVLEAVVDTTRRVSAQSISVVSTTNTGFVAPTLQALLATLFP